MKWSCTPQERPIRDTSIFKNQWISLLRLAAPINTAHVETNWTRIKLSRLYSSVSNTGAITAGESIKAVEWAVSGVNGGRGAVRRQTCLYASGEARSRRRSVSAQRRRGSHTRRNSRAARFATWSESHAALHLRPLRDQLTSCSALFSTPPLPIAGVSQVTSEEKRTALPDEVANLSVRCSRCARDTLLHCTCVHKHELQVRRTCEKYYAAGRRRQERGS